LNLLSHLKLQLHITRIIQCQVSENERKVLRSHLIKLKSEYGGSLSWVFPYPGDWHILFLISFSIKLIIHCT
jgi:hypothetical protein